MAEFSINARGGWPNIEELVQEKVREIVKKEESKLNDQAEAEVVFATFSMVVSDDMWLMLDLNASDLLTRLVEEHVIRQMRRHSSFNDKYKLQREAKPFPIGGFRVVEWRAVALNA